VVEAARTDGGCGALHFAADAGRLEVCRYLVEKLRVDVDAVDHRGMSVSFFFFRIVCRQLDD
jgi:hypothetical protein